MPPKEEPTYPVEQILAKRTRRGRTEYLVKWQGWSEEHNSWEPQKNIVDKNLITDFKDRAAQKRKSSAREATGKRPATARAASGSRTRRLRSSPEPSPSPSPSPSPEPSEPTPSSPSINDENSLQRDVVVDVKPPVVRKTRSNRIESDDEDDSTPVENEKPQLDESIRELLWQPTKLPPATTSITEVTDQTGVTVLIRELNDLPTSADNRPTRFLGYGNGGRGGRH